MSDQNPTESLEELVARAKEWLASLTEEEREEHFRLQRESWVRGEMGWPEPKYHFEEIDGVMTKVYETYEDYCNG